MGRQKKSVSASRKRTTAGPERASPEPAPLPTVADVAQVASHLPNDLLADLSPGERAALVALLAGYPSDQAWRGSGLSSGVELANMVSSRRLFLKLEQRQCFQELMGISGLSDAELSIKFAALLNCGDRKVEANVLKLAMQVKGHLAPEVTTPAATNIHLHVMPAQDGGRDVTPDKPTTSPVLDLQQLMSNSDGFGENNATPS